jgi:hypothetical protein
MTYVKRTLKPADPVNPAEIRANWPHTAVELLLLADQIDRGLRMDGMPVPYAVAAQIRLAVMLADQRYQELDGEGWPP